MSPELQTIAALAIVGLTVLALFLGRRRRRGPPGCEGTCSCPSKRLRP